MTGPGQPLRRLRAKLGVGELRRIEERVTELEGAVQENRHLDDALDERLDRLAAMVAEVAAAAPDREG